jgi:hypothetical protein
VISLLNLVILKKAIWTYIDPWSYKQMYTEFYETIVAVSLLIVFYNGTFSKEFFGKAAKYALFIITITAIMSLISSIIDPMYARNMGSGQYDFESFSRFKRLGGGRYGFSQVLVLTLPSIVYLLKKEVLHKYVAYFLLFLYLLTLIRMQIFANVLVGFLSTILSFVGRKTFKKSFFYMIVVIIIFMLIPASTYGRLLTRASNLFDPGSNIYYKLNDMAYFVYNPEVEDSSSGTGTRLSRYSLLWPIVKENFFTGGLSIPSDRYWSAGAHLYWMYKLAAYGIIGLFMYVFIHYYYIKMSIKFFDESYKFYFLLSVFSIVILGLMKNLAGRNLWVAYFMLLHGYYYIPLIPPKRRKYVQK